METNESQYPWYRANQEAKLVEKLVQKGEANTSSEEFEKAEKEVDRGINELDNFLKSEKNFNQESFEFQQFVLKYFNLEKKWKARQEGEAQGVHDSKISLAEFLNDRLGIMRKEYFLDRVFMDSKFYGVDSVIKGNDAKFLFADEAKKFMLSPGTKLEEESGYDHFAEILIEQAIAAKLKELKDNEWEISLTDSQEDFHAIKGTDIRLNYRGLRVKQFTALVDLTFARAYGQQRKEEKTAKRYFAGADSDKIITIFAPAGGDNEKKISWHADCKKAIDQIKKNGQINWTELSHKPTEITQKFLDSVLTALNDKAGLINNIIDEKDRFEYTKELRNLRRKII